MSSPVTSHVSGSVAGELSECPRSPDSQSLGASPSSSLGEHRASDWAQSVAVSPSGDEYEHLLNSPDSDLVPSSVLEERFVDIPDPRVLSAALRLAMYNLARRDESRQYDTELQDHALRWAKQDSPERDLEAATLAGEHQQRLREIQNRFNANSD